MEVSDEDTHRNRVFSREEDSAILDFLYENNCLIDCRKVSVAVWKLMELKELIPQANWELLRKRFHEHILPNLHQYRLSRRKINFFSRVVTEHGLRVKGKPTLFEDSSDEEESTCVPNFQILKDKFFHETLPKLEEFDLPKEQKVFFDKFKQEHGENFTSNEEFDSNNKSCNTEKNDSPDAIHHCVCHEQTTHFPENLHISSSDEESTPGGRKRKVSLHAESPLKEQPVRVCKRSRKAYNSPSPNVSESEKESSGCESESKKSSFEVDESSDNNITPHAKRNSNSGGKYTKLEDYRIIKYIISKCRYEGVGGVQLWKSMEDSNYIPKRTWQSLKERFRKVIFPRLDMYDVTLKQKQSFYRYINKNGTMKTAGQRRGPRPSREEKSDSEVETDSPPKAMKTSTPHESDSVTHGLLEDVNVALETSKSSATSTSSETPIPTTKEKIRTRQGTSKDTENRELTHTPESSPEKQTSTSKGNSRRQKDVNERKRDTPESSPEKQTSTSKGNSRRQKEVNERKRDTPESSPEKQTSTNGRRQKDVNERKRVLRRSSRKNVEVATPYGQKRLYNPNIKELPKILPQK